MHSFVSLVKGFSFFFLPPLASGPFFPHNFSDVSIVTHSVLVCVSSWRLLQSRYQSCRD